MRRRSGKIGVLAIFVSNSISSQASLASSSSSKVVKLSCGWALSWVNNPEAKELFDFLNPFIKLPDRRVLGGDILKQVVSEADKVMETTLKEDPVGRPYVWKAVDISAERENFTAVINKTEAMLTEFKKKGITVCAIVTDSASVYAAARRRMRILKRSIIFLPCFAHQINLCVGEIFKESTEFKTTIDRAIRLATYFKNSNHKFFIAHLKEQQYETYKKYIAIAVPGETRWNSVYYMCISLLKTQQALQILAINYKPPIVETHRQGGALTLPREIFEIIDSSTFWDQLILINEILEPYCKILNVLQCDKARLFQVVHSMNYLIQFWLEYPDDILATQMINRLEKRWKDWEQLILLLSYLLHPEY
ncbi:ribonuclease H-like domain-containing protein [Rhizophagus irregularis DAOM 181602=DAOM 197198]|nr:ribonuclease H-like domain-containing protein [Rhizophagus irregularis DAOM 181602=DAOM 197198]